MNNSSTIGMVLWDQNPAMFLETVIVAVVLVVAAVVGLLGLNGGIRHSSDRKMGMALWAGIVALVCVIFLFGVSLFAFKDAVRADNRQHVVEAVQMPGPGYETVIVGSDKASDGVVTVKLGRRLCAAFRFGDGGKLSRLGTGDYVSPEAARAEIDSVCND